MIHSDKTNTAINNIHLELSTKTIVQPITAPPQKQLVNDEKTTPVKLKHGKKTKEQMPDEKAMQTKVNNILAIYYDSVFSTNDSVKCVQLGENL